MSLTIKNVEEADARIKKRFGKSIQRATADYHFVDRDRVQTEYLAIYPNGSIPDGFVDPRSRPYQVWIPIQDKYAAVVVHETMHLYGMWYKNIFAIQYGKNIDEGVTEFFTRQVLNERSQSYPAETAEIEAIVSHMRTEEPLRQAFFQGCFSVWQGAVGLLTFVKWQEQMYAGQWKAARNVLAKPPDKPRAVTCKVQTAP